MLKVKVNFKLTILDLIC